MGYFTDKYKNQRFLLQREDNHNKYWTVKISATNDVLITWGRLGTKGQSQTKSFPTEYSAVSFADSKFNEKKRKGYQEVKQSNFEKATIEASIVGAQNKCSNLQWVEYKDGRLVPISDDRLMAPDCDPKLHVSLETRKEYGGRNLFDLLFSLDSVTELSTGKTITKVHPLYELTSKVEEAVGRQLSG